MKFIWWGGGRKYRSLRHNEQPSEHLPGLRRKQLNFNRLIKRETFLLVTNGPLKGSRVSYPVLNRVSSCQLCLALAYHPASGAGGLRGAGRSGRARLPGSLHRHGQARSLRNPGVRPRRQACTGTQEPAEPASGEQLHHLWHRLEGLAGTVSG